MTQLRAAHAEENTTMAIDGKKGILVDAHELNIWEPYVVKLSSIKTSMEVTIIFFLSSPYNKDKFRLN